MKNLKQYKKSFGRFATPPPTKVIENKKGRGSYNRRRFKQETRKLVKEVDI